MGCDLQAHAAPFQPMDWFVVQSQRRKGVGVDNGVAAHPYSVGGVEADRLIGRALETGQHSVTGLTLLALLTCQANLTRVALVAGLAL